MTMLLSLETIRRHKIVNRAREPVGNVEDFIFDPQSGGLKYLVFSFGGLLGMGDKLAVIPFDEAELDFARERVILNFHTDDLKEAPGFVRGNLPDFAPAFRKDIDGFYAARRQGAR